MRRKKQQLSDAECIELLKSEPRGVLSVLGDEGYPYGFPIDHFYNEADGHIYFHCAKAGHKIDSIKRCNKVSLCVYDKGFRKEGEWALNIKSVIVFGTIGFVGDRERALELVRSLALKYTSDTAYIEKEIKACANSVQILELIPEHITGKIVNES